MRVIYGLGLTLIFAVAFSSCFEAPTFPVTPEIEFDKIAFIDVSNPSSADTLALTINFKDGDGDLGLDESETDPPFHDKTYFLLNGTPVYFPEGVPVANPKGELISYKTKREATTNDTLPGFVTPYNCSNWDVIKDNTTQQVTDTLYFQLNPNHYNIFVDFYVKRNDGSGLYDKYDWIREFIFPNCQVTGFDGRFPILSKDLTQKAAQEGKIRYSMKSVAFNIFFSIKTLKLKIMIQDRALHKSNTIETVPFSLH